MSLLFDWARYQNTQMSKDWETFLDVAYTQADQHCNGHLLNKLGKAEGVSAYSLFKGSAERAFKYASDELHQFWLDNGRVVKAQFERDYMDSNGITW